MSAALKQKPEIKIKLTVVKGPHAGQVFLFDKNVITIGRGPENNVVLLNDPQVSRAHAQISLVNNELEVSNLSQKNAVVVDGASVQKWKLINNSSFVIGDSEINIEYDLGQAVVSVPTPKPAEVVPIKPKAAAAPVPASKAKKTPSRPKQEVAVKNQEMAQIEAATQQMMQQRAAQQVAMQRQQQQQMMMAQQMAFQQNQLNQQQKQKNDSLMANPSFKYILVVLIVLGGVYAKMSAPNKKAQAKKIASTLKYEDEVAVKLNSEDEIKNEKKRKDLLEQKNSPQNFRINESFLRGMRDYQLGNYARAQELFQVVLNLDPDHALAKRHLYLAKVRFDELVQEKLMLGESYFKKDNFRMCQSMYTQVMQMLDGKNTDPKYILAEKKATECSLAKQGIK
ncbi:MAG: FHA domain-containing protein [Pseudobdellovibrio sp.]